VNSAAENPLSPKVFVSYSHKDSFWLERLRVHLKPLVREGKLELWDDKKISTGSDWPAEIAKALAEAHAAILLISADFLASDFITHNELPPLLAAAKHNGKLIMPLHVEWSRFSVTASLKDFQSFNPPDEPLVDLSKGQQEKWLVDLSIELEKILHNKINNPPATNANTFVSTATVFGGDYYIAPTIHKPSWPPASAQDSYGVYADLAIHGIVQRFRWLNPGTFLMGSPANEPERGSDETLHRVTLSSGFWLADTACSQALWQAVMGNNPSYFQGDADNSVENVSWNEVQVFIQRLQQQMLIADLPLRLPTEVEWEYACRAGTETPFAFGENINPELVNYNGHYPYNNAARGLCREMTLPVKSLPANAWGLYQMHGNVWEWCQDCYAAKYGAAPVTDPAGPLTGSVRVLRGGSWFSHGRRARSAGRRRLRPDARRKSIGFRLALGRAASG